ncbi:rRNA processing/ribosome biogenesis-domain-containing protein [Sporodiniella umbellata]|nr:rRNA processing/ribosome biogenesis-domain-containing protein [Sporodiniella umbellata]
MRLFIRIFAFYQKPLIFKVQMSSSMQNSELLEVIINNYLSKESILIKNLPFVLDALLNHNLLAETSNDEIASLHKKWTVRLNSLLHSKVSAIRWCSISLIKTTCESSHSLLVAHAKGWSAQLLGFLAKPDADIVHKESIEALQYIFGYTHDKPELHREIATPNMQKFNQLLLQLAQKETLLPTVLSALTANNKYFPSNSKHIAEQSLQLCLSCIDGTKDLNKEIVLESYKCIASLYRTGGKSVMAEQWKEHVLKLIGSVHECLNRLFDTVDEDIIEAEVPSGYPFVSVGKDHLEAFPVLVKRVQLIQDCIGVFLGTSTTVSVSVPSVQLVDLICRIYSIFDGSLMRDFKDKNEFHSLIMCLPTLHYSTNKMLSSLIYCTGQEMLRYSKVFSKALLRLLSDYKSRRTMKLSVYKLITLCIDKFGYKFSESIAKPLIAAIVGDLQIVEHKSASIVTNNQNKGSHKKRKTDVTNSDSITSKLVCASASDVQKAAVQTLTSFLSVYGFSLDNSQRSTVDSIVLKRLLQNITLSNMTDEETTSVKIELYNCLIASVTYPIETQASILPLALRLFAAGINDSSNELQAVCKHGMTICDLIIHSRLPPIQRAAPKESSTTNTNVSVESIGETFSGDESPSVVKESQATSNIIELDKDVQIETRTEKEIVEISESDNEASASEPSSVITKKTEDNKKPSVFDTSSTNTESPEEPAVLELPVINLTEVTSSSYQASVLEIPDISTKQPGSDRSSTPEQVDTDMTEPQEYEKPLAPEQPAVSGDGSDDDFSAFELPNIDMAGPDSDDEDE